METESEPMDYIFDRSVRDDDGELLRDFRSYTFSEQDLITLCEIPCSVQMDVCNRYRSYELMVIEQLKQKGIQRTDTHRYIMAKFFKKFKYHYKKQVQWEQEHRENREKRLFNNKVDSILYLEDKNSIPYELPSEAEESLQIQYTPYETEDLRKEDYINASLVPQCSELNETSNSRIAPIDTAVSDNNNANHTNNSIENHISSESSEGLEIYIHKIGANVEVGSQHSNDVHNAENVPCSLESLPPSYTEFQQGAHHISTQRPLSENMNRINLNLGIFGKS